ncbi:MAG: hypothetical protein KJS90_09230 [Acidobacteria bacterium]|nr:hypothetical protein [Acidobacteriota bacterium]
MTVFAPEFSSLLRRLARRSFPFAVFVVVLSTGLLVWSVLRHRSRLRRGEVSVRPGRTRIAPLP